MNKDSLSSLGINTINQRILARFGITTVEQLLTINHDVYKRIVDSSNSRRSLFDEIFIAIKGKGLSYAFEPTYYTSLRFLNNDLAQVKIRDLEMAPYLRKYLAKYDNVLEFLIDIASSRKKMEHFLYYNINAFDDYNWLYQLLDALGNEGTILKLVIMRYQSAINCDKVTLYSPLSKIFKRGHRLFLLNAADIYTIGDLVSFTREDLLKIDGFNAKKVDEINGTLYHYGFYLGKNVYYNPITFSLHGISIRVLDLSPEFINKLATQRIYDLHELIFSPKAAYFTDEEINYVHEFLKNYGIDLSKSFLYSLTDKKAQKCLELMAEKQSLNYRIKEIDRVLQGIVPLSFNDLEVEKSNPDNFKSNILGSNLPVATKEYLSTYKDMNEFFLAISQNFQELNRFLYFNIDLGTNLANFDEFLSDYGNDGVILKMIIKKYIEKLNRDEPLYRPLNKVFSKGQTLTALNNHHVYFLGNLIGFSREMLKTFQGINSHSVNFIGNTLNNNGYFLGKETSYHPFKFDLLDFEINLLDLPDNLKRKLEILEICDLQTLLLYPELKYFDLDELILIRSAFSHLGFDLNSYFTYIPRVNEVLKYNNLYFEQKIILKSQKQIESRLGDTMPLLRPMKKEIDVPRKLIF